jgi:phosphoserine phosphatase RsbU/P
MLPRKLPPFPGRTDFQVFARMEPARSVGGDFYDYFPIGDDRFGFVCGDVSGKGVASALFMASTRTLLRATAKDGTSSAECMQYVNTVLSQQGDGMMFVTLLYGILDMRTGELDYCNAGHMTPYLIPKEGPIRLVNEGGGLVAGLMEIARYEGAKVRMSPGDTFVMYTDGVTEAFNATDQMFEKQRFEQSLESGGRGPVDELVEQVMSEVREFAGGAPQSDDITVLAIRYLGA